MNSDYSQLVRSQEDWCEYLFRPCYNREFDPARLHVPLQLQTGCVHPQEMLQRPLTGNPAGLAHKVAIISGKEEES